MIAVIAGWNQRATSCITSASPPGQADTTWSAAQSALVAHTNKLHTTCRAHSAPLSAYPAVWRQSNPTFQTHAHITSVLYVVHASSCVNQTDTAHRADSRHLVVMCHHCQCTHIPHTEHLLPHKTHARKVLIASLAAAVPSNLHHLQQEQPACACSQHQTHCTCL